MTITKERLAEIKARCDAAFVAPWTYADFVVECGHPWDDSEGCRACEGDGVADVIRIESPDEYPDGQIIADVPGLEQFALANGSFIAHARQDVPDLVAEVERLRGLISALPSMGSIGYACPWCCAQANKKHEPDCDAFTPDGEVK